MKQRSRKVAVCEAEVKCLLKRDSDDRGKVVGNSRKRKLGVYRLPKWQENLLENNESSDLNYKELYRKTLQEVYQYEEIKKRKSNENVQIHSLQENENKLINLILYFAMEHETLVEIILLLPLTIMAFYIVVIEKGSLFQFIEP